MHTVCLLRSQLNFTRAALRKREYMVQKRSKMTIISDILPVKIYVWTAIPTEPRQVHSGHKRVNVAGKKSTREEGDASILLPRGYRNLVLRPRSPWFPHVSDTQVKSLITNFRWPNKRTGDCRDYFPEHVAAARQNVSQTFLYGVTINARLSQTAPSTPETTKKFNCG